MRRLLLGLAVAFGGACASPSDPAQTAACPPAGPRAAGESGLVAPGDAARGEQLFAESCVGCHAPHIARRLPGAPPHTPRLDCPAWLAAVSDDFLYLAIRRGPGRYGHGDTPPLGEFLTPADVSDLVAYLRSLPPH